jgi:uncharacterized membrane protein
MQVVLEAIIVGFILLLVSIPIMKLVRTYYKDYGYEKYYIATIMIGMITHFAFEYSGANLWYCKNGSACLPE